jgi:hypothetical protein
MNSIAKNSSKMNKLLGYLKSNMQERKSPFEIHVIYDSDWVWIGQGIDSQSLCQTPGFLKLDTTWILQPWLGKFYLSGKMMRSYSLVVESKGTMDTTDWDQLKR